MPKSKVRNKRKNNKKAKTSYSPIYEVNIPMLSKIGFDCWDRKEFNTIDGIEKCKGLYNRAYKTIEKEIFLVLEKYHPATWIREAYLQLEVWTLLWYKRQNISLGVNVQGPEYLIPVGRYGWRYILEISLEQSKISSINKSDRPNKKDVSIIFTLLVGMHICMEMSNFLHYLPHVFSSAKIQLSPYMLVRPINLNTNDEIELAEISNILKSEIDESQYPELIPDNNDELMRMINDMMEKYYGFTIEEAKIVTEQSLIKISSSNNASVIVDSYQGLIELCEEKCKLSKYKIEKIFDFILLDTQKNSYVPRNYLIKSQQLRMVNHFGAIIYLDSNLETIYSKNAAKYPRIYDQVKHIILSPALIPEWINNFILRLASGQRNDLKLMSPTINKEISLIEKYYHINIFEKFLMNSIEKVGLFCVNVKKINGKDIECGEIDILAYSIIKNELFIIEAKNLASQRDAKSLGQVINDHFNQKKYHNKFLRKIAWVNNNPDLVIELFKMQLNITIKKGFSIKSYFVSRKPSIIKKMVIEYSAMGIEEFLMFLKLQA